MLDPQELAVRIPALLVAITFHEFAHARVALAFGDPTAEEQGRVTLNPLAHLDPIGTIGMVVGWFGWGRPVPVNPSRMSHPRADFFVSAAGPVTNLVLASVGGLAFRALYAFGSGLPVTTLDGLAFFLKTFVLLNLSLGFFNFIPLFPLDGSHMLQNLLPLEQAYAFRRFNEAWGSQILFGLILAGVATHFSPLWWVLGPFVEFGYRFLLF